MELLGTSHIFFSILVINQTGILSKGQTYCLQDLNKKVLCQCEKNTVLGV